MRGPRVRAVGRAGLAAALALAAALLAPRAGAEVRRVEVVGVAPAGPHAPPDVPARRTALEHALEEGVRRVARQLLEEAGGPPPHGTSLGEALGDRPVEYTVRYSVLEDRGERRSLLVRDPEVSREYVVVAEVHVDVARVEARLREAGLLAVRPRRAPLRTLRVEAEGLASWEDYRALRRTLLEAGGAESAVPERFEAGRAVVRVRVAADAATLWDRIARRGPDGLRLRALERGEERLELRVIDTR